jgi:hypothetical protein
MMEAVASAQGSRGGSGAVHDRGVEAGDVALQAGQLPGPVDGRLAGFFRGAGDLQEPGPGQRSLPGSDFSARAIWALVALSSRLLRLNDHWQATRRSRCCLPRAHRPDDSRICPSVK